MTDLASPLSEAPQSDVALVETWAHSTGIPVEAGQVVFTAQSKAQFFCRDAICEFVFHAGFVPLNPFRTFGYFLGDRVDRNAVRGANNSLIRCSDELWVFGEQIANGVLFEVLFARSLSKPIRFFSVSARARDIHSVDPARLTFERELYRHSNRGELQALLLGSLTEDVPVKPAEDNAQLALF